MIEREKLSQLKRIALLLVTRMLAKILQLEKDIEDIVTVELLIEKREECKKIIDISKVFRNLIQFLICMAECPR